MNQLEWKLKSLEMSRHEMKIKLFGILKYKRTWEESKEREDTAKL